MPLQFIRRFGARRLRRSWAVWALVWTASVAGCTATKAEAPPTSLILVTGRTGTSYQELGTELVNTAFSNVPGVKISVRETTGSLSNADSIQEGTADLGFMKADVAYFSYTKHAADRRLRGIAALYMNAAQIFVREDSSIHRVSDLRGHRIGIAVASSPPDFVAGLILESHGLLLSDVFFTSLTARDAVSRILNRSLDAVIMVTTYPASVVEELTLATNVRLLSLESGAINLIRGRYPFYVPTSIPSNTYPGQKAEVKTIGIDSLLVCRDDLPEDLVYRITKGFFESLSNEPTHQVTRRIDLEQGPAMAIPAHVGAARFYREQELRR